MINLALVFFGGGTGAICRYLAGVGLGRVLGLRFGYLATLGVNVLGGLLMGLLVGGMAFAGERGFSVGDRTRLLLGVGLLGGFTTFSSFSLEAVMLVERKAYGEAAAYIVGSVVLSLLAVLAGLMLMRKALA